MGYSSNRYLGLHNKQPWKLSIYERSDYDDCSRLMWTYREGQLYNKIGGKLARVNDSEALLVHWQPNMEKVWADRPEHQYDIVFSDVHGINWDFMGGEYIMDRRTGLVLTADKTLHANINFSIPFDTRRFEARGQVFKREKILSESLLANSASFLLCLQI